MDRGLRNYGNCAQKKRVHFSRMYGNRRHVHFVRWSKLDTMHLRLLLLIASRAVVSCDNILVERCSLLWFYAREFTLVILQNTYINTLYIVIDKIRLFNSNSIHFVSRLVIFEHSVPKSNIRIESETILLSDTCKMHSTFLVKNLISHPRRSIIFDIFFLLAAVHCLYVEMSASTRSSILRTRIVFASELFEKSRDRYVPSV